MWYSRCAPLSHTQTHTQPSHKTGHMHRMYAVFCLTAKPMEYVLCYKTTELPLDFMANNSEHTEALSVNSFQIQLISIFSHGKQSTFTTVFATFIGNHGIPFRENCSYKTTTNVRRSSLLLFFLSSILCRCVQVELTPFHLVSFLIIHELRCEISTTTNPPPTNECITPNFMQIDK